MSIKEDLEFDSFNKSCDTFWKMYIGAIKISVYVLSKDALLNAIEKFETISNTHRAVPEHIDSTLILLYAEFDRRYPNGCE